MADIHDRFVLDAPERARRELLFSALNTYLELLKQFIPTGAAWINGGFGTRKTTAPHDVDVVVHPTDWDALGSLSKSEQDDFRGLLTHQSVVIGSYDPPLYVERLQPVGGALDAFVCWPGQESYWAETWASVKRDDGTIEAGKTKGFAEVTW